MRRVRSSKAPVNLDTPEGAGRELNRLGVRSGRQDLCDDIAVETMDALSISHLYMPEAIDYSETINFSLLQCDNL